ncbi:hypothetical protein [Clavibacter zhangzhiyongii]|uniref:hypothetical protein n=1 Tax=Clavibacter zhangzhiyongii TaxID=2768071 RepID=UPI0039DFFE13
MTDATAAPDAALARRLRDDPEAARRLDELRRDAYGRAGSTAPLVEVPAALRARTGVRRARAAGAARRPAGGGGAARGRGHGAARGGRTRDPGRRRACGSRPRARGRPPGRARPTTRAPPRPLCRDRGRLPRGRGLGAVSAAGLLDGGRPGAPASGTADASPSASAPSVPRGQAMGTPDGRRGAPVPDFTADPPVRIPLTDAELAEELRIGADQSVGPRAPGRSRTPCGRTCGWSAWSSRRTTPSSRWRACAGPGSTRS